MRDISSALCCLELRRCSQQYSPFRDNQHYPDQLTWLTWLLWERPERQNHVEASMIHRLPLYVFWWNGFFLCVAMRRDGLHTANLSTHTEITKWIKVSLFGFLWSQPSGISNRLNLFEHSLFSWHVTQSARVFEELNNLWAQILSLDMSCKVERNWGNM